MTVAQIFNLLYRRIEFGRASDRSHVPAFSNVRQSETLGYSAARRSRKQIVLVLLLVLDCSISDYENEDDDERFAGPATIWTDTDRLQVCATGAASTLNRYPAGRQTFCP